MKLHTETGRSGTSFPDQCGWWTGVEDKINKELCFSLIVILHFLLVNLSPNPSQLSSTKGSIFSCDSSSIRENVRRSIRVSVSLSIRGPLSFKGLCPIGYNLWWKGALDHDNQHNIIHIYYNIFWLLIFFLWWCVFKFMNHSRLSSILSNHSMLYFELDITILSLGLFKLQPFYQKFCPNFHTYVKMIKILQMKIEIWGIL